MVQKSSSMTLVFTSTDGRAFAEVGSQIDVGYTLDSGARAVVSLPLLALVTLSELVSAVAADEDVLALVAAATPSPSPSPKGRNHRPNLSGRGVATCARPCTWRTNDARMRQWCSRRSWRGLSRTRCQRRP